MGSGSNRREAKEAAEAPAKAPVVIRLGVRPIIAIVDIRLAIGDRIRANHHALRSFFPVPRFQVEQGRC